MPAHSYLDLVASYLLSEDAREQATRAKGACEPLSFGTYRVGHVICFVKASPAAIAGNGRTFFDEAP